MSKEEWNRPKRPSDVGGEALIEGVMMRSKNTIASAIRKPDGDIIIDKREYTALAKRNKLVGLPIVRGGIGLFESMVIGMKALMNSAEYVDLEEDADKDNSEYSGENSMDNLEQDPENISDRITSEKQTVKTSKFERFLEKVFGDKLMTVMIYFSVVIALLLGIGIFMLLPNFLIDFLPFDKSTRSGSIIANLFEGLLRIVIFFGYIILVSKMKDIRRVFEYHGAEHKTIYCYESEEELTIENSRKHTRFHPRCGTAFLFVVMIISIIVFSFAGWHNKLVNMGIRLALLPFIAGISYEFIKLAGKTNSRIMRIFTMPGLFLQRFTTREPDDEQLEVAIAALKAAIGDDVSKVEQDGTCSDDTSIA